MRKAEERRAIAKRKERQKTIKNNTVNTQKRIQKQNRKCCTVSSHQGEVLQHK